MFGTGLYLAVLGLFSFAVGVMVRHTAAAITAVIVIFVVLGDLSQLLPGTIGRHVNAYMPANTGILITHTRQQAADLLSPWQGFVVLCLWTAARRRRLPARPARHVRRSRRSGRGAAAGYGGLIRL